MPVKCFKIPNIRSNTNLACPLQFLCGRVMIDIYDDDQSPGTVVFLRALWFVKESLYYSQYALMLIGFESFFNSVICFLYLCRLIRQPII